VNHQEDHTQGQPHGEPSEQMATHRKRNYDRETEDLAGFPEEVSESLLFFEAGGRMRSIFTRATRLPSISAMVKRKSAWTKLSPPVGMNPS
jgi:hypothetical protein